MSPLRALVGLGLALTTLAGGFVARRSSPPHEWAMSPQERVALSTLGEQREALDAQIATVCSQNAEVGALLRTVRQREARFQAGVDEIVFAARREHEIPDDVALARSGSTWVRR